MLAMNRWHLSIGPFTLVVHGDCIGADKLGGEWAEARDIPCKAYKIEAGETGFTRNQRMLDESCPDVGVWFPGGNGTSDMRERCTRRGVPLYPGLWRPDPQLTLIR